MVDFIEFHVEPSLHFWNGDYVVMVDDPFDVFLDEYEVSFPIPFN